MSLILFAEDANGGVVAIGPESRIFKVPAGQTSIEHGLMSDGTWHLVTTVSPDTMDVLKTGSESDCDERLAEIKTALRGHGVLI